MRARMEARFAQDLGDVRVHSDPQAAESARALEANAYAAGRHIVLDTGAETLRSPRDDRLLAHELAHVVRQRTEGTPAVQGDLKARNREISEPLPDYAGITGQSSGSYSYQTESAEAAGIRKALAALIAADKVSEVCSTDGATSWFAANHHRGAQLEEIRQAFVDAGYPLADRMARAVYDIHGEYLYSGRTLTTTTIFGDITSDLGVKVRAQFTRSLTEWEIRQARRVFKQAIDYGKVTIEDRSRVGSVGGYARTVGNTIYFPGASSRSMALLVHELTHVWQYQTQGWSYAPEAIWAQVTEGYSYTPDGQSPDQALLLARQVGRTLTSFNLEQQGDILADYFRRLQQGSDVSAYQPFVDDI